MINNVSIKMGDTQIGFLLAGFLGAISGLVGGLATGFAGVSWLAVAICCSVLPVLVIVPVIAVFGWSKTGNFFSLLFYLSIGVFLGFVLFFSGFFPLAGLARKAFFHLAGCF